MTTDDDRHSRMKRRRKWFPVPNGWLLGDGSWVVTLDADGADIRTPRGGRQRFYRRVEQYAAGAAACDRLSFHYTIESVAFMTLAAAACDRLSFHYTAADLPTRRIAAAACDRLSFHYTPLRRRPWMLNAAACDRLSFHYTKTGTNGRI